MQMNNDPFRRITVHKLDAQHMSIVEYTQHYKAYVDFLHLL